MNAYYEVTGGPVKVALESIQVRCRDARKAHLDFAKEVGATAANGCGIFSFEGKAPKGWRKSNRYASGYFPSDSAVGAVIKQRVAALPTMPGSFDVIEALRGELEELDMDLVNDAGFPGWAVHDGRHFLHCDPRWLPADRTGIVEIKASEYPANP